MPVMPLLTSKSLSRKELKETDTFLTKTSVLAGKIGVPGVAVNHPGTG